MQAKKILVPTDFSPCSAEALETAAMLAKGSGGELLIAFVEEPLSHAEGIDYLYDVPEPETEKVLARLKTVVPPVQVRHSHHVLKGTVVDAVLEFAEAQHVDLIVVGTHGRRGITALLMGSVAENIVRKAKCPVLTVKAEAAG